MDLKTIIATKAMYLVSLTALWLASAPAQAQTAPEKTFTASMPLGQAHMGATGPHDMRASMMMGMESMQQMPESGDTDKDFAMMKLHHEQTLNMAEMELANGKSSEMKAMARQIIAAQKKEIAQFDKWLAKQKWRFSPDHFRGGIRGLTVLWALDFGFGQRGESTNVLAPNPGP